MKGQAMRTVLYSLPIAVVITLIGCGSDDPTTQDKPVKVKDSPAKDSSPKIANPHPDKGPRGGRLIDIGRNHEFHAEIVEDHDAESITIYILDHDMNDVGLKQNAIAINLQVNGESKPFNATVGKPSDHDLFHALEDPKASGKIRLTINDTPYAGTISGHGHKHAGDDALVWRLRDVEEAGFIISLGHHAKHLHAGEAVEPAVSITRDGQPVDDAKVFNSLVDDGSNTVLAKEVSTVYEPTTVDEPAHYAQGELKIPADLDRVIIRYRILLPGVADEKSFEIGRAHV
jgi:hypothetical protein